MWREDKCYKIEPRLKKNVLTLLLVFGILSSAFYSVFSYIFTDKAVLSMLEQTKPEFTQKIIGLQKIVSLPLINMISLVLLLTLIVVLVILIFTKKSVNKLNFSLAIAIPCLLAFAYPVVSRDIFSYLDYAKMVAIYHQNPYMVAPQLNSNFDLWLGFVHNTERVYAYGPIALLINLIPMMLLGAEKLIVNVYFYKLTCLVFFLVGAKLLLELTKNKNLVIILWILNPFIINELLINGHNDLMMIVFFWGAIYLQKKSKNLLALLMYSLSVGTKFVTAPLIPILFLSGKWQSIAATIVTVILPGYLIYHGYLPWYFTWIYFCLPLLKLTKAQILALLLMQLSLTLGYAGFVETGMWGPASANVIIAFAAKMTNPLIYLFMLSMIFPYLQRKLSPEKSGQI